MARFVPRAVSTTVSEYMTIRNAAISTMHMASILPARSTETQVDRLNLEYTLMSEYEYELADT